MLKSNFINVTLTEGVAIFEIDDPSANTLTLHLLQELEQHFLAAESNPSIKGIILIGKGEKFFSGGVNIGMLLTAGKQHNSHFILYAAEVLDYINASHLCVVTLINGNITGGGLELALIADYRIAISGDYNIGFPEVRLGVIPGMGGTQRLSHLVGPQRALELITQGVFITPEKALSIGLVDQVLPSENFKKIAVDEAIDYIKNNSVELSVKESFNTNHLRLIEERYVYLTIENSIAKIIISKGCDDIESKTLLLAINELIIELRADENVYGLLIENKSNGFGIDKYYESDTVFRNLVKQIFSRISGYPRICALLIDRQLAPIEIELALHCDYRLTPLNSSTNIQQTIPIDPKWVKRYQSYLDKNTDVYELDQLITSGLYIHTDDPIAWISRFTPPNAAGQAIGYAKLAITQGHNSPLAAGLLLERHLQEQLFMSYDSQEGMKAYVEKRKPSFTGI